MGKKLVEIQSAAHHLGNILEDEQEVQGIHRHLYLNVPYCIFESGEATIC